MKVKLDENLSHRLLDVLRQSGHDGCSVQDQGLKGADDLTVWAHANEEGRLLITQDLDLSDIRKYPPGAHSGILLLRLKAKGIQGTRRFLENLIQVRGIDDLAGSVVVATEGRLRTVKPPS